MTSMPDERNDAPGLDDVDRKLLDVVQSAFPLSPHPYEEIGKECGISEMEALARIGKMRQSGLIRRLGANFQSAGLGFVSTLCAARVPASQLESFIEKVNAIPGVTHNYERNHPYNIWFTLIGKGRPAIEKILDDLRMDTGVEILDLPATRLFKIRVDFPMSE